MLGKTIFAALALTLFAANVASAQPMQPQRDRGEEACGRDARKMCRKVLNQGDMVVLSCLQQNAAKLSNSCKKMLRDNGQL
ncbi:MAG: hypothetical protein J0H62_02775 [Rhizobiales bacterium]|nr:hypothetical protein [Hyphomicrobiales bacterium]